MMDKTDENRLSTSDIVAATAPQPPEAAAMDRPVAWSEAGHPAEPANKSAATAHKGVALLPEAEAQQLRSRWAEVQTGFVDEPRQAVQRADELVAEIIKKLAETFAAERAQLDRQWTGGGDVSTEDLRLALQRYRSFFDRLLSL
jgi:hypothetical protein